MPVEGTVPTRTRTAGESAAGAAGPLVGVRLGAVGAGAAAVGALAAAGAVGTGAGGAAGAAQAAASHVIANSPIRRPNDWNMSPFSCARRGPSPLRLLIYHGRTGQPPFRTPTGLARVGRPDGGRDLARGAPRRCSFD